MWFPVWTHSYIRQESQFNFNRPDVFLSWSGRTHSRYGNCMLKNCCPDVHPPWFGCVKPYMEITCSGRATVRTSMSHHPDAALKQERFSAKFSENPVSQLSVRTAQVHSPDGVRTYYSSRPFCTSAYKWRPRGIENYKNSVLNSTSSQRSSRSL
jgi:hypothetical protein